MGEILREREGVRDEGAAAPARLGWASAKIEERRLKNEITKLEEAGLDLLREQETLSRAKARDLRSGISNEKNNNRLAALEGEDGLIQKNQNEQQEKRDELNQHRKANPNFSQRATEVKNDVVDAVESAARKLANALMEALAFLWAVVKFTAKVGAAAFGGAVVGFCLGGPVGAVVGAAAGGAGYVVGKAADKLGSNSGNDPGQEREMAAMMPRG